METVQKKRSFLQKGIWVKKCSEMQVETYLGSYSRNSRGRTWRDKAKRKKILVLNVYIWAQEISEINEVIIQLKKSGGNHIANVGTTGKK